MTVTFIETPTFTRRVVDLLSDSTYGDLQTALAQQPDLGVLIPGTGGLRKVRWGTHGRGKRGGVRVIYYWHVRTAEIEMLLIYAKNAHDTLTPQQIRTLRALIEDHR